MLKIFVVQCHPRNIFNIELFPNYGIWLEMDKSAFTNCIFPMLSSMKYMIRLVDPVNGIIKDVYSAYLLPKTVPILWIMSVSVTY